MIGLWVLPVLIFCPHILGNRMNETFSLQFPEGDVTRKELTRASWNPAELACETREACKPPLTLASFCWPVLGPCVCAWSPHVGAALLIFSRPEWNYQATVRPSRTQQSEQLRR